MCAARRGRPELKDYELLNWFGLFAPAGTPEPVVDAAQRGGERGCATKIAETLQVQGIVPRPMSAPDIALRARRAEKFGAIVKQANIKAEN
jgi:hypothetical protein